MNAKQYVSDLAEKDSVASIFLIKEKLTLKGKNGKLYMSLVLCDRTGTIDARVWDNVDEISSLFQAGDFARVKGAVQVFQNRRQIVIHKIEKAAKEELDLRDFMGVATEPPERMLSDLKSIVSEIKDPYIKKLIFSVIDDPEVQPKLLLCPAAKSIHHAYIGGLLEHILSITRIMVFLGHHYPHLNRDLLVFGAIFHDIGKIWELAYDSGTAYTDRGRLIGHLVMAVEIITQHSEKIPDFPPELKTILQHIVLSHHGRLEFGSPKTPQFLEAYVVAAIDDFDSKINTISMCIQNERGYGDKWSRFNQGFERYFYLGITSENAYPRPEQQRVEESEATVGGEPSLLIPEGMDGLSYKKGSNNL